MTKIKIIFKASLSATNQYALKPVNNFTYIEDDEIPYCEICHGLNEGSMPELPCPYCDNGIKRKPKEYDL